LLQNFILSGSVFFPPFFHVYFCLLKQLLYWLNKQIF
jgi:hypothetical protein